MDLEKLENEALAKLVEVEWADTELAHMDSDRIVAEVLRPIGMTRLADDYDRRCKHFWYA